jgi:hypothetical protein
MLLLAGQTQILENNLPRLRVNSGKMDRVDRLGWEVGFALKSYGVRIGIRADGPAALERVCRHLPSEWQPTSSPLVDRVYSIRLGDPQARANPRRLNVIYGDHERLARSADLESVFETLESDLRIFVAELATHRVFVHAGVVGWRGKAIVIPGRSYSGKSTLVAALLRAGASYYSDEYAVLDARGRVHPFAKPLELREEGKFVQTKISAAELGGQVGSKPLPVGLVLLTQYKQGASWRPRKLSQGKAVLELLFNTVSARRNPERAMATLQCLTAKADVLKGVRGDAGKVVAALLARVANSQAT